MTSQGITKYSDVGTKAILSKSRALRLYGLPDFSAMNPAKRATLRDIRKKYLEVLPKFMNYRF